MEMAGCHEGVNEAFMKSNVPKEVVRKLRRKSTDAEIRLWAHLRSRRFQDVKFRRQHPIGPYVVDFCSVKAKMIVELDGGQHSAEQERDAKRTAYLNDQGFDVMRFWDHDVLNQTEAVLERIRQKIGRATLTPPSP